MADMLDLPADDNSFYERFWRPIEFHPKLRFVFGSNLGGIHGAGVAKLARMALGAQLGVGKGPSGMTYAIPTKGFRDEGDGIMPILPLEDIEKHVKEFVEYTNSLSSSGQYFYVTKIGTGLAKYEDKDIAPFFKGAKRCWFHKDWEQFIR